MAKKFTSTAKAMKFHVENVEKLSEDYLPKLAKIVAADNNDQFVPEDTARLKESAFIFSKFDEGIIIWQTPYARRRFYEGSITGVAFWTLENKARNYRKYNNMIIKEIKRRT